MENMVDYSIYVMYVYMARDKRNAVKLNCVEENLTSVYLHIFISMFM